MLRGRTPHLALLALLLGGPGAAVGCAPGTSLPRDPAPQRNAAGAPDTLAPLGAESRDLLLRIRALHLPSSRNRITVHHAEGHWEKALGLRALIEDAMRFYEDSLNVREELHLAVLTPEQWAAVITWQPYGIPGVAGTPPVAFLPATDDNLAANDARAIRDAVSPATIRLIEASGHSYEEGAARYVDLVGLHELGHTYTTGMGIRPSQLWLGELLATYFAYAYLRQHQPRQAQLWDGILQAYRDAVRPDHTSLADFERLYFGVGARNYVWYQARFQEMVREAYDAMGLDFLREVRAAFPRDEVERPNLEETLRRLERMHPGFGAWASGMAPPAPGLDP
jgi:hypothetical protein